MISDTTKKPKIEKQENTNISTNINDPNEIYTIQNEYKMWSKNVPFLYDLIMTHALEWPSLTLQWLPDHIILSDTQYNIQRLLLGTYTSDDEQNYLRIAEVRLPKSNTRIEARPDRPEIGSYGIVAGKVDISQQIIHDGEINRARYMPQNPNIIATKSCTKDIYIFDRTKHPSRPAKDSPFSPNLRLSGHKKEGYGLSWCPIDEGILVSGSDDSLICLWDISSNLYKDTNKSISPLTTYSMHKDVVEDVCFHPKNSYMFASCGDDKKLFIWDTRSQNSQPSIKFYDGGHTKEINSICFNFHNDNIFATGSSDNTCGMWDLRVTDKKLHSFETHTNSVYNVSWSPHSEYILASSSIDRRVNLWDIAKIGQEQNPEDAEDGPPELLFIHAGHIDKIADISWNPCVDWMIASISDDSILQIWNPTEPIYNDNFDDIDEVDEFYEDDVYE